ncbi:unnamed protein product [Adineta steineri]|uniref:Uncharacterized protein n=1 Tax=Adineta steineri TaxID=433720 RepID=A0A819VHH8_9BILA|nr:unnamed protein product [Adineta steineri]
MLQKSLDDSNEQEKSKYEQISIIPKRDADQKAFRICVPQSRFLSQLTWIEKDKVKESLAGMVEVRVHCVGINFRDVLKFKFCWYYCTYVTGDGTYHSHIMINSQFIIRIPSNFPLTDKQLCSLPCSILTVI